MKRMKNLLSLVLALAMVMAMTLTAMAADVTVGINKKLADHDFEAYQIFTGTQTGEEKDTALGDVVWGSAFAQGGSTDAYGDAFLNALKSSEAPEALRNAMANCKTAQDVADVLDKNRSDTEELARAFAQAAYDFFKSNNITGTAVKDGTTLDEGYYLFKDITTEKDLEDAQIKALNEALLQVTGDQISISVKTDAPSAEKKVQENVKPVTNSDDGKNYGERYNDVADYNIGDTVRFAFYSKVPDMSNYDTYEFVFHDVMDAGLTFDGMENVKVTIGGTEVTEGYEVVTSEISDGCTFEVKFADLKAVASSLSVGKDAEIRVDFTATLNSNAKVGLPGNTNTMHLEYSNNPNDEGTGKTPEDKVIVFTYELDVKKVDGNEGNADAQGNKRPLKDAEFVLYREVQKTTEDDRGESITETVKEYAQVADDKLTGWTETEADATILKSGEDGLFKVAGLDDGQYYLKETKAPAGYNLLKDPILVNVPATTKNDQNWSHDPDTALTDLKNGVVSMEVENNKGVTLPETGGIGTTIFTVSGIILVIIAGVLLVTKKRMSKEE